MKRKVESFLVLFHRFESKNRPNAHLCVDNKIRFDVVVFCCGAIVYGPGSDLGLIGQLS